jgi:hypothetical protein
MVKYFIFLLSIISFSASAQVVIPDAVADYYLELDDKSKVWLRTIDTQGVIIQQLKFQIITQQSISKSCLTDAVIFNAKIATKDDQLAFKDKENKLARKEIRRQKFHKVLIVVGVVVEHVVIIILIL